MLRGGFLSGGLLEDVTLIAMLDTGVAVWALDAAFLEGDLGIRASSEGEPLGRCGGATRCPPEGWSSLTRSRALALLFSDVAPGNAPRARSERAEPVRGPGSGRADPVRGGGAVGVPGGAAGALKRPVESGAGRAGAGRIALLMRR